ncbi:MAG TPA: hypothetical protein VH257_23170 [Chloroflexota bacterium]|nr:hypothetical protein [Chloroflexota bacterium]
MTELRIFGLPEPEPAAAARALAGLGFKAVTLPVADAAGADAGAPSAAAVAGTGLQAWGCRAAFAVRGVREGAEALLARDVSGTPRPWFGSGCPNQPPLRRLHLETVAALARGGDWAGFTLDGIRFASPHAGAAFWTCFCPLCAARAEALGIDLQRVRHAVGALGALPGAAGAAGPAESLPELRARLEGEPGLADWLRLRREVILEHVREVRAVVDAANGAAPGGAPPGPSGGGGGDAGRRSGFQLGAYLFPPSLASLVGQDYATLAPSLDVVSPMLYRTIEGDACLASEVGALSALGLLAPRGPFTAEDVGAEVALARAALGMSPAEGGAGPRPFLRPRLVPILQLADEAVAETTAAALDAGADGVDYFAYRAGTERHVAQVAEVVATVRGTPRGAPGPDATGSESCEPVS